MSAVRQLKPGYVVTYPNRERSSSHAFRALTVLALLVSALVILAMAFGGWSAMEGLLPIDIAWGLIYLVMAWYVRKWARGLLPIAAALAALMLTFAAIALTGYTGVAWSDRTGVYGQIHNVLGSGGFSSGVMDFLTVVVIITQVALIAVALQAFGQHWNIEYEMLAEEAAAKGRRSYGV